MNPDQLDQPRSRKRIPRYFYHTPFSFLALMLALTLILPLPRVPIPWVTLIPQAGADVPLEPIDLPPLPPSLDPVALPPDALPPDQVPDLSFTWPTPSPQPDDSCAPCLLVDNGTTRLVSSDKKTATVFARDPDNPNDLLVQECVSAACQLKTLEDTAIDEVMDMHGLKKNATEENRLLTWERSRVRAQMLAKLTDIINKPEAERTDDEKKLFKWLTYRVWQKRIDAAQFAWDQYRAWQHAVSQATCSTWEPPNKLIWYPDFASRPTDSFIPPTLKGKSVQNPYDPNRTLTFDVNGCEIHSRNCVASGCSPGRDGTPSTDTTSNSPPKDVLMNGDDGEACFNLPFTAYDECTYDRCFGFTQPLSCLGTLPKPPSYKQFKSYGQALTAKTFITDPQAGIIASHVGKAAGFLVAAAVAGAVKVVFSNLTFPTVLANLAKAIFPHALRAGTLGAVSAGAFGSLIGVVIIAVVIAVLVIIDLITVETLEPCLKGDVKIAAGQPSGVNCQESKQEGKPNLQTLIQTESGHQEIFLAFTEATLPEPNLNPQVPALGDDPLWAVMDEQGNAMLSKSGKVVNFTPWHDDPDTTKDIVEDVKVGLVDGWLAPEVTLINNTVIESLALGIEYQNCDNEKWMAWRIDGNEVGKEQFVLTHNGDKPPTSTYNNETEFAAFFAAAGRTFQYLDADGSCLSARINHPPTLTNAAVGSGPFKEGEVMTFGTSGVADPDGDTVSVLWNLHDGSPLMQAPSIQQAFRDNGDFNVTATATDAFGAQSSQTFPVTVTNAPPTAAFNAPSEADEGSLFHISLTNPSDPSTADTAAGFTFALNCVNTSGVLSAPGSCQYPDNGSVEVSGTIADKDGGMTSYTKTVTINNVPPTVSPLSPLSAPEGSAVTVPAAAFSDPALEVDDYTCRAAFGDGGTAEQPAEKEPTRESGPIPPPSPGACPNFTHTYADNGAFPVQVTVTDDDGGSDSKKVNYTITNVAPTATFSVTAKIFQGESSPLAFSDQFDPSPVDTKAGFTYSFDCTNDGTLEVTAGRESSFACAYPRAGSFTARGTIKDKDGETTPYTASITVLSPQAAAATIGDKVQALAEAGVVNGGQANALTVKLENAITQLDKGKNKQATNMLQAFINEVTGLMKGGVLSPEDGQALIDLANRVIASIAFV